MVSKEEAGPSLGSPSTAPKEKAMTVRSVLLRRDSPDTEGRAQRRQQRPAQQVRFKDLEESISAAKEPPTQNTPRASAAPKRRGASSARRSWPQAQPPLQPPLRKACASTAIQTSPGLRRPSWAAPLRSGSASEVACLSAQSQPPTPSAAQLCPQTGTTLCPLRPPPPYPGQGPGLSLSSASQCKPCTPCPQRGSPPPYPLAQGPLQRDPHLWDSCPQKAAPQVPHESPSPPATSGKPPSPASPMCLGAQPAACLPPQSREPSPAMGPKSLLPSRIPCRSLSPMPAGALCQVHNLLQLVPIGKRPEEQEEEETRSSASQGDIRSRLRSLEGVLETSQQTIRVLLGVIQDLERKEAQRDGRCSYQTGQDVANCGTCRDCACVIYSVEHDFRQQEGRLQRVLSTVKVELGPSSPPASPAMGPPSPPCQPLPVARLSTKGEARKAWRKCFWFL
ncbi:INSYN2B protein isoform X2 [Anolis carolinensis]|uniref:INSYN2B protein isoform X2 n=1 Tax=Anolis carolinensis TaxID=28377 RepID=UPI002F2B6ED6